MPDVLAGIIRLERNGAMRWTTRLERPAGAFLISHLEGDGSLSICWKPWLFLEPYQRFELTRISGEGEILW